jgi:DNA-directed RNA polymerase sigma subunit (sigma70/sigma32)
MKDKKEDHVFGVEEQMEIETFTSEFQLQKDRIRNILDEAIYKLRLLVSPWSTNFSQKFAKVRNFTR